jgi:GNAT superfamily N-acetyltransferase
MMYETREIMNPDEKSRICNDILRALPDWFGIEESIIDYVRQVRALPLLAVFDGVKPVGFVAVKPHNAHTVEVFVMGVLGEYHRQGIGRTLIDCCERYCRENNLSFLTVKTLDESRADDSYSKTRLFYFSVGFKPLEVFPLLWDESNPCLFMAKHIAGGEA